MKIGIRKPSIKKSIKARTTGRVKRSIKKAANPLYGKKGMGVIKNPKKAVYNKVYSKTTVGLSDFSQSPKRANIHSHDVQSHGKVLSSSIQLHSSSVSSNDKSTWPFISIFLYALTATIWFATSHMILGTIFLILALFVVVGLILTKIKQHKEGKSNPS